MFYFLLSHLNVELFIVKIECFRNHGLRYSSKNPAENLEGTNIFDICCALLDYIIDSLVIKSTLKGNALF